MTLLAQARCDRSCYLLRRGAADAVNIGEGNLDPLVGRNIHPCYARHAVVLLAPMVALPGLVLGLSGHALQKAAQYTDKPSKVNKLASTHNFLESHRHLVDLGHAVNRAQDGPAPVIGQERRGLIVIDTSTAEPTSTAALRERL